MLPSHVRDDPALRERFEREARSVAALNHPHICTLYDVGREAGTDFLVLEHLEGETLAQRLTKGALPLEQALTIAIQIADALDKAHRAGIVHRDVKPGNVMLTKSGAKLLDFGLAKMTPAAVAASGLSMAPTGLTPVTMQGTILGTLQYMAPEQIEGQDSDAQTDIFAFGCVLFEMLTGKRAFDGKTQASLIGAIMNAQPARVSELAPIAPPQLDDVIRICLAKERDDRWRSLGDVVFALKLIEHYRAVPVPGASTASRRREILAWSIAGIVAAAGALVYVGAASRTSVTPMKQMFEISTPAAPDTWAVEIALSPSGRYLAGISPRAVGGWGLWIRGIDQHSVVDLPGTANANYPFWSPDDRFLAYFAEGKLKKLDISGGTSQVLTDAALGSGTGGGTWNRNGIILFAPNELGPIFRVPASGGTPTAVTELDKARGETAHLRPHFFPDGTHFLYLALSSRAGESGIYVGSLDSKTRTRLVPASAEAQVAEPDQLVFMRDDTLMTQHFDFSRLVLSGDPVAVAEHVGIDPRQAGIAAFAVSDTGMLVYRTGVGAMARQLLWTDRTGAIDHPVGSPGAYESPKLSRDGKRLAFFKRDDVAGDIWIQDLDRANATRLTFDPAEDNYPLWSPDGTRVVFASNRNGIFDLFQKNSTGTGADELLLKTAHNKIPLDWSADGRYILYQETTAETADDIWALPLFGERKPAPVLTSPFSESWASFSPDGRWIAYASNESGQNFEIYVQSFPPSGRKIQISTNMSGYFPGWRPDGKELFFDQSGQLMAVDVATTGTEFTAGIPHLLFRGMNFIPRNNYEVVPGGQRFLVVTSAAQLRAQQSPPLTVLLNWRTGIRE